MKRSYEDPALGWLCRVFGFTEVKRFDRGEDTARVRGSSAQGARSGLGSMGSPSDLSKGSDAVERYRPLGRSNRRFVTEYPQRV